MSRYGFNVISSANTWNSYVDITQDIVFELTFFKENWDSLNGCPIKTDKSRISVTGEKIEVASDASNVGGFVYEVSCGAFAYKRPFTPEEAEDSSTSRELSVFEDFYNIHGENLKGKAVVHYTDAHNVALMLQIGSRTMKLHERVVRLYLFLKM